MNKRTVYILRGLPGSGKSFLCKQLCEDAEHQKLSCKVCSADSFFVSSNGSYNWKPSLLGKAHEECRANFADALMKNVDVIIVDNTNTTIKEMKFYVEWALNAKYDVQFVEPTTSWKFNVAECAKRNIHGVPLEAIQRMLDRYVLNVTKESFSCSKQETK